MNRQMPTTGFPLRRDVACRFFPGFSADVAVKRLNRWINGDPELLCLLTLYGYKPRSRRLTLRQVRIIEKYI